LGSPVARDDGVRVNEQRATGGLFRWPKVGVIV
jgi:hypothetical protein